MAEHGTGAASEAQAATPLRRYGPALLVALGVALLLATRACHPIAGLGNADIAGILYEADRIVDGELPYVDTMDMKSPGTWYVVAAIFRWFGREFAAVQVGYTLWCLAAAPALWLAARALYGPGLAAGAAVLLYLSAIGLFDLNYSAWMTTPYAWAFAGLLIGLRGRGWGHLLGGVFAAAAVMCKAQAFVLAPCFAAVWLWGRRRGEPGAGWSAWPLWLAGALLGLAPLLLWYQSRGELMAAVHGLFPVGIALEYGEASQGDGGWWWRVGKIPLQLVSVYPLHVLLGAAALLGVHAARRAGRGHAPVVPQCVYFVLSLIGCGVGGMRFYVHYLPQYLPALALLAAHPAAWAYLRSKPEARAQRLVAAGLAVACWATGGVLLVQIPLGKASRVDHRGTPSARQAGEYIAARSRPEDTIQVWGWAAWSVYYWADRKAPSPVFKVLGQVTDYNQNGLFSRSRRTDFRPGPAADVMLAAFERAPPAFFVRTQSFFPGVKDDPLDQWAEMKALFERSYVLRERFGKLRVYERRARLGKRELKQALAKAKRLEMSKKKKRRLRR